MKAGMIFLAPLLALLGTPPCLALDNGLGLTPQMGYNTWYDLTCNLVSEQLLKDTVDTIIALGLRDLGYKYFNLDDCWASGRQPNGTLIADPKLFPSGTLKPLADYVHSKNMLFGTYTDRGTNTCAGRPGALGYEALDAQTYASWGVDYLKEDSCHATQDHGTAFQEYATMRDALNKTGRPIFFSLCGWEEWYAPVGKTLGNSWRIGPDDTNWAGVLTDTDVNSVVTQFSGPGGWNDPCLLLAEDATGQQRMTEQQTRTQFNLWAINASPLLISANVRNMSAYNLQTYRNAKVIAVNQDKLGKQGFRVVGTNFTTGGDAPPLVVAPCNASDPSQIWKFDTPARDYIYNPSLQKCWNVDDCGENIIQFDCVTSGGTCAGASSYANMQFVINPDQTMSSYVHVNQCVYIRSDDSLWLDDCDSSSPKWTYQSNGLISTANNMCVSIAAPASSGTNVWVRQLSAASTWALLFVNVGPTAANVTCGPSCFAKMGFSANQRLQAEDLWANTTTTISSNGFTIFNLAANGGSSMFKVSP